MSWKDENYDDTNWDTLAVPGLNDLNNVTVIDSKGVAVDCGGSNVIARLAVVDGAGKVIFEP